MFVGRAIESRRLSTMFRLARSGKGSSLVISGEPGVGKTALLNHVGGLARDISVVHLRVLEEESNVSFAALSDLVRKLKEYLSELPQPQARALTSAVALEPATGFGERLPVFAGTLSLLSAAAKDRGLLVLVDDAHWLDQSSADALFFAAQRIRGDRVAMVFAQREGESRHGASSHLPQLRLLGLSLTASAELVTQKSRPIVAHVVEQLQVATRGNPLALKEAAALLTSSQRSGVDPLPEPVRTGPAIQSSWNSRLAALPKRSRLAALVAATAGAQRVAVAVAAAEALGCEPGALEACETAGLLTLGNGLIEFRHPLLRSAIYEGAAPADRRRAHLALSNHADPEHQVWHLAAATIGADEKVAAALEMHASQTFTRSGYPESMVAFERAAALSTDSESRSRRLLAAAGAALMAGRGAAGATLLQTALDLTVDPLRRADIQILRGRLLAVSGTPMAAHDLLVSEALAVAAFDPLRSALMFTDAILPGHLAGEMVTAHATAAKAFRLAREVGGSAELFATVFFVGSSILLGRRREVEHLVSWCQAELAVVDSMQAPGLIPAAADVLTWIEDLPGAESLIERFIRDATRVGAVGSLPYALAIWSEVEFLIGRWAEAFAHGGESVRLARELGQEPFLAFSLATLARVEAATGRTQESRSHLLESEKLGSRFGALTVKLFVGAARGLLELGAGHPDEAIEALAPVAALSAEQRLREPLTFQWHADLIEAYVRVGRTSEALTVLRDLESQATDSGGLWAAATASRCRALLSDPVDVEQHMARALSLHKALPQPFERARTELVYGELLRRNHKRSEARPHLRIAMEEFERLGAEPWVSRTRSELKATGERLAKREHLPARLTSQEMQVALLVSQGATNREVASQLFLSPKTIEVHLSHVYSKLELRSRTELARLFTEKEFASLGSHNEPSPPRTKLV